MWDLSSLFKKLKHKYSARKNPTPFSPAMLWKVVVKLWCYNLCNELSIFRIYWFIRRIWPDKAAHTLKEIEGIYLKRQVLGVDNSPPPRPFLFFWKTECSVLGLCMYNFNRLKSPFGAALCSNSNNPDASRKLISNIWRQLRFARNRRYCNLFAFYFFIYWVP